MEKIKCYCGHTDYCDCGPLELPARTAMQELIEDLKNNMVISIFERLQREGIFIKPLEKEKMQIIDAFEDGYKSCDIDEAFEINRKLASGEQYYKKNYNQKIPPCSGHAFETE